ncbi:DUF4184 family protein [Gracilibacillus xinjiangensis]|uniref:DUF4184 family protein n=1 Tax=Gracilibacillus xinjiangensis TaxID=1193282 RepID=A0ABV8WZ38_9BACI
MPLTFAHPAAVLPFSRNSRYVDFLAMVLGSMSPDFEYFLRGMPYGEIGHTLSGFICFNLPIVIIVYWIYKFYIHQTLFSNLPSILQESSPKKVRSTRWLKVIVFLYSALFGMVTHVVWDSFTHLDGFMVRNFPFLHYPVEISHYPIPIFKFLQHGGTLVGLLAIIAYMYFRAAKNRANNDRNTSPKQKVMYWGQIALLTALLFCFWFLIDEVSMKSFGIMVVRIIDSALISLLVVSLYFNYKCHGD